MKRRCETVVYRDAIKGYHHDNFPEYDEVEEQVECGEKDGEWKRKQPNTKAHAAPNKQFHGVEASSDALIKTEGDGGFKETGDFDSVKRETPEK
jgi:hypothetical protein